MVKRKRPAAAGATEAVPTFEAVLTLQELSESERNVTGAGEMAFARRVTLSALTRSSAEMQAAWSTPEGAEAMLTAVELATDWRTHLKGCMALADTTLARLLVTGKAAMDGVVKP